MSAPFLLLQTRPEDALADAEYEAFVRLSGLEAGDVERFRLEAAPLPAGFENTWNQRYSALVLGGSPFTSTDVDRSETQIRVEKELARVLGVVIEKDLPFLGLCYGVGVLGLASGAVVDRTYSEPAGISHISLTPEGIADPVLSGVGPHFDAFVGHKESTTKLPAEAVLLATSGPAPVQMYKLKNNIYATQFHPELDPDGLIGRIEAYRENGYFDPEDFDAIAHLARNADVTAAHRILANFAKIYLPR